MQPFQAQPINRVRKSDRAAYDRDSVFAVLDRGLIANIDIGLLQLMAATTGSFSDQR